MADRPTYVFENGAFSPAFGHWLAGLIDGEAWFGTRLSSRGRCTPVFALKMRDDERETLEAIVDIMGIGRLSGRKAHGSSNPTLVWQIQSQADCRALVAFLDEFPLRTRKASVYEVWRDVVLNDDQSERLARRELISDLKTYSPDLAIA